jgi:transcriptional regulator with XRE-family HTH domain
MTRQVMDAYLRGRCSADRAARSVPVVTSTSTRSTFGPLLRQWRTRRRLSQLDLAVGSDVSARHISFLETGRSQPSREMVLRLATQLDVPLRERNQLLLGAGYAPEYRARPLDDAEMAPVRAAVDAVLRAHAPHPALAVDRHWDLVSANAGVDLLTGGVAAHLLEPPVNVLRLSLHPDGLAGRIRNLAEWRGSVLGRLARELAVTGDPRTRALLDELAAFPGGRSSAATHALAVPLRLAAGGRELAFLSTVTTFGTAVDVTLAELSIEAFLPADAATAQVVAELAAAGR